MTVSSTARVAGPYLCNGSQVEFSFSFKVFAEEDVRVVLATALGVETDLVLSSDYTVELNADQEADPGGSITVDTAYATGYRITLTSNIAATQGLDIPNAGPWFSEQVELALDKLTILVQQVDSRVDRAILMLLSEGVSGEYLPEELLAALNTALTDAIAASTSATTAATSATDAANDATDAATTASAAATAAAASAAEAATAAGMLDTQRIDVATASTVNLTTSAPNTRHINLTGTTQVDGFTVAAGKTYFCRANAAFPLKNNASIVTQRGADISVDAGATWVIRATAENVVEVLSFTPGTPTSGGASTSANNTWTAAQRGACEDLGSGTSFTPNFDTNPNKKITLNGSATLNNPSTTPVAGQSGYIWVYQDGTGNRSLALGSYYKLAYGVTSLSIATTASAWTRLGYVVQSASIIELSPDWRSA